MTDLPRCLRARRVATIAILLAALAVAGLCGCTARRSTGKQAPSAVVGGKPVPTPAMRHAHVPKLGRAPFRVCAFAFHSPDELAAIKSLLPAKEFDFVDLTPTVDSGPGSPPSSTSAAAEPGWLLDTCRTDLRCDIVIYSGEFAGGYFGRYGYSLDVREMEEASCQARCRGLFHDPREVFLLACNTLATKSADERTPEEYLAVLRAHGFSRADAERVVDLRYGPLGPSFRESSRRIFAGVPRVYGFSSIAPSGEFTAPRLHHYFQDKGDYAHYLAQVGRDSSPNHDLLAAFAETSLVQTSGLNPAEPASADRSLVCRLYDESSSVGERLLVVREMFSRSDFLAFVPTVEVFLSRHPPEAMRGEDRRLLDEIAGLEAPRRQMTELMYRLTVSTLKMQMAHLALQLGWIDPQDYHRIAVDGVRKLLLEPLSTELVDVACELAKYDAPAGAGVRAEEIPEAIFLHSEGYRLLDCLAPSDARVNERILVGLKDIDESTRLWAAYALSRRLPLDDAVLLALARRLNDPSPGVRERLRWIFRAAAPVSPAVLVAIRERDADLAGTLPVRAPDRK